MVLIGAWRAYPVLALAAGVGIVVGVAYIWRAMQQAFFSGADAPPEPQPVQEPLPAITLPERLGALLLIAASLVVGLAPQYLLRLIITALHGTLFISLSAGGLQ